MCRPDETRRLYPVWHDWAVVASFAGSQRATAALTSRHRDGEFVAEVMQRLGLKVARGSTGSSGLSALRQVMQLLKTHHVIITPDGPRGPRRRVSPGIVFIASKTGAEIVPTWFSCDREWRIQGSWTDLSIPKPFANVVVRTGPPIHVPPNLSRTELAEQTDRIQRAMDELGCPMKNSDSLSRLSQPAAA